MKTLFYFLLLVGLTSCTTYNVSSQTPNQYTSVTEQVIIEEPTTITYINYTPTLTFSSYYNYTYYWNWRKYYFAGYPMYLTNWNPYPRRWYWGYNWNPYQWNYWNHYNPYAWNHHNWYNYNWHHNNWHHPHHNSFFSPVAQSNHNKLTHHKKIEPTHRYTSIPSTPSRKPDRAPIYNRVQSSRPTYNRTNYRAPQSQRQPQHSRPQPQRQHYNRVQSSPSPRLHQSTPSKRR